MSQQVLATCSQSLPTKKWINPALVSSLTMPLLSSFALAPSMFLDDHHPALPHRSIAVSLDEQKQLLEQKFYGFHFFKAMNFINLVTEITEYLFQLFIDFRSHHNYCRCLHDRLLCDFPKRHLLARVRLPIRLFAPISGAICPLDHSFYCCAAWFGFDNEQKSHHF